jgi:hypothetical protein
VSGANHPRPERRGFTRRSDKIANKRNELLYAHLNGVPSIKGNIDGYLRNRRRVVISFLRICGLTYPYDEYAIFVQNVLNALLIMMGKIEEQIE